MAGSGHVTGYTDNFVIHVFLKCKLDITQLMNWGTLDALCGLN